MKNCKLVVLAAAFMLMTLGCEGAQEEMLDVLAEEEEMAVIVPEKIERGLLDGHVGEIPIELEDKESEEGPAGPVTAEWTDFETVGASGLQKLNLKVTNISKFPASVRVDLICNAFISHKKTRPMVPARQKLEIGESATFSFMVSQMPLQVLDGAGAFRAKVYVELDASSEEAGTLERTVATAQMYYQHSSDYKKIEVLDTDGLIRDKNGVILNKSAAPEAVLGRILHNNGAATEILGNMGSVDEIGEDGNTYGTIDGLEVEFVTATEEE